MVANRYYIRNISMYGSAEDNSTLPRITLITKDLTNAVGLDYDYQEQKIYWSDVTNDIHKISRMDFNGGGIEVGSGPDIYSFNNTTQV